MVLSKPSSRKVYPYGSIEPLMDEKVIRELEITCPVENLSSTSPCTSWSKAGKKDGFTSESGQLLLDCTTIIHRIKESSCMPRCMFENVLSTTNNNKKMNNAVIHIDGIDRFFPVCASVCSPSKRNRQFATNRPPPKNCTASVPSKRNGLPPSLNGDHPELRAASIFLNENGKQNNDNKYPTRIVHPKMSKFNCLMSKNPTHNWGPCIYQQDSKYSDPTPTTPTPEEVERLMGYKDEYDEIGVTAFSAERAIRNRIKNHNFTTQGCLVSFKGCANDVNHPCEPVEKKRRLELLGNSVCINLLEAFLWRERELFPPIEK